MSHVGLGISAINAAKCLRSLGIQADVWPISAVGDLAARLAITPGVTHVVISAPWIATADLASLCNANTGVQFVVNCHSNLGFLQADPNALRLVREGLDLQSASLNFSIAANCQALSDWLTATFGTAALCLPNMYFIENPHPAPQQYTGGTLRIGVFGATRVLKNMLTGAGAALAIARQMRVPLELYVSSGRNEGAGSVMQALHQMVDNVPGVILKQNGWQTWPQFRRTVGFMHLLIQLSYTESFNVVTADGISQGVPSVISPAIDWGPQRWMADPDDALDAAFVGRALLNDPLVAREGMAALQAHDAVAMNLWKQFLQIQ